MSEKKARRKNAKIIVLTVIAVLIASLCAIAGVLAKTDTAYGKIYVNDLCVGKKNTADIKTALEEKYSPENTNVIFTYKNTDFEVNGADFDLKYDLDKTSENAYQAGKGKNFISRGFNAVKYSLFKKEIPVEITFDQEKLYNILKEKATDVENPVTDTVTELKDGNLVIQNGKKGNGVDIDKIKKDVEKVVSKNKLTDKIEVKITEIKPKIPTAQALYDEFHKEPKDVEFSHENGEVHFSEHVTGVTFDVNEAQKILDQNKHNIEPYSIPVEITQPKKPRSGLSTTSCPTRSAVFPPFTTRETTNARTISRLRRRKSTDLCLCRVSSFRSTALSVSVRRKPALKPQRFIRAVKLWTA